jgi:tetratricopeptide (TPR) repeat protein
VTVRRKLALAHKRLAEANLQLGKHADATSHGDEFLRVSEALASQDPDNSEALLELAMAHNAAALDALKKVELKSADTHATEALRIVRRLALIDPNNLDARRNVAVGMRQISKVAQARQQAREAVGYFVEAIEICRGILNVAPDRSTTIADLADLLKDLGMLHFQVLNDKPKGIATVSESVSLWRRLIDTDSANLRWQQRGLETGRLLGKYQVELKKHDEAGETFRASLATIEPLSTEDHSTPIIRREVGLLHIELVKLAFELKKTAVATNSAEDEIESLEKEARERPDSIHLLQLLDGNHAFLADLYTTQRNTAKAAEHLRKAIDAAERGLKLDPEDNLLRGELQLHLARLGQPQMTTDPAAALKQFEAALAHSPRFPPDLAETSILLNRFAAFEAKAGDCCEMLNRPADALAHYQKALEFHTRVGLIEENQPRVPAYIAYDHRRMAEIRLYLLDFSGASVDYDKAQESLERMKTIKEPTRPLDTMSLADLRTTETQIKLKAPFVKSLPQGIESLDAAVKQPPRVRHLALRVRVAWLLKSKKYDEAAESAERMTTEKAHEDNAFALAAVEFSRLAATDSPKPKTYAARAIELLNKAKDEGYFKDPDAVAWLNWEPLFEPLRKEEAFQVLVKAVGEPKK